MQRSNSPAPHGALARFAVLVLVASPLAFAQEREAALIHPPLTPAGQFGRGLALSDSWAFVGEIASSTVSFYKREPDGWKLRWMDRGPAGGSLFSLSLATDGETLVAGSQAKGWPKNTRGGVRIYELIDDRWRVTQEIDAPGFLAEFSLFGATVAVEGDLMAIGAPGVKDPFLFAGMLLIYERVQGVWTLSTTFGQEILEGPNGWHGSLGDGGLEIVGDVIAAAASGFAGGVYIFERDGQGWNRTALISEPNPPDEGKTFGRDLALSADGQTLVIGQPDPDGTKYPFAYVPGRAHVFQRDQAGGWVRVAGLRASDEHLDAEGTHFGKSVEMDGDLILIGATNSKGDPAISGTEGAVYIYERLPDGTWPETETRRWWGSTAENSGGIGSPLIMDRGFVLTGNVGRSVLVFESTTGMSFCPALDNSTDKAGRLSAVGGPQIAKNTLTLSARDCPRESPGCFLAASNRSAPAFQDGSLLCLAPPILRVGGLATTGKTGAAYHELDLVDPRLPGAFGPGTTIYFQYWFFDAVSGKSNLTNAVAVTFE
jgi:FG-GAP repeat protein